MSTEAALREQLRIAAEKLKEQDEFIQRVSEASKLPAVVIHHDKEHGKSIVELGSGAMAVVNGTQYAEGRSVYVLEETKQIVSEAVLPLVGMSGTVSRLKNDIVEVSVNGTERRVGLSRYCPELKLGDRVTLSFGGNLVLGLAARDDRAEFSEETNVSWGDIGGLEDAKLAIREAIEFPLTHKDLYGSYNRKPSKGVLLHGEAGNGKTMLGKATATAVSQGKAKGGFFYVKGPELLSMWVGETEARIRALFAKGRDYYKAHGVRAVLFIDEAEAILGSRERHSPGGVNTTVVPMFLAEMDGLSESGVFVMVSTNLPDTLDSAIVRDGRIDRRVYVGRPNEQSMNEILQLHLKSKPLSAQTIEEACGAASEAILSDKTIVKRQVVEKHGEVMLTMKDVISGAVVAGVVNRATENALRRDRENGAKTASGITKEDLVQSVLDSARELSGTDLRNAAHSKLRLQQGVN